MNKSGQHACQHLSPERKTRNPFIYTVMYSVIVIVAAQLNVKINAASLSDKAKAAELVAEADEIAAKAVVEEKEILDIVNSKING